MAISFIGAGTPGQSAVTFPTHQAGDLLLVFSFRDGSNSPPPIPAGWTEIENHFGSLSSMRVGFRIAPGAGTSSGVWNNGTTTIGHVYRGVNKANPFGAKAVSNGSTNSITIPALTLKKNGGSSWVVGALGHVNIDTDTQTAVAGTTTRATGVDAVDEMSTYDTNGGVTSWAGESRTGTGTAGEWVSCTLEIQAETTSPTLYSDDFNRADGNLESNAGSYSWSHDGAIAGGLKIESNKLSCETSNSTGTAYKSPDIGNANHFVQYQVGATGFPSGAFVCCRLTDNGNFVGVRHDDNTRFEFYKRVGGALTGLGTINMTVTVGDVVRLETHGQNFIGYVNGTVIIAGNLNEVTLSSTRQGIVARAAVADGIIENYAAGLLVDTEATASITEADDTVVSTATIGGAAALVATASITEADDTVVATGKLAIVGVSAITEADDTVVSTSQLRIAGVLAITEDSDTVVSTGKLVIAAVATITEQNDTVVSSGALPIVGTASITEQNDTVVSTGKLAIAAVASVTEANDTVVSTATLAIKAAVNVVEADDTVVATGNRVFALTGIEPQIPPTVGSPNLTQVHALTASGVSADNPTVDSPALVLIRSVTPTGIASGAPVVGAPALGQAQALILTGVQAAAPTVDSPALAHKYSLQASGISTGTPSVGSPVMNRIVSLSPNGVQTSPVVGSPTVGQAHSLQPSGVTSSPVVGHPAITQTHSITLAGIVMQFDVPQVVFGLDLGSVDLICSSIASQAPSVGSPQLYEGYVAVRKSTPRIIKAYVNK